jgi:hypothetical protein
MENQITTNFAALQVIPVRNSHPIKGSQLRVDVRYEIPTQTDPESVQISVLVKAGDRSLVEIQQEAISRAIAILQGVSLGVNRFPSLHPDM